MARDFMPASGSLMPYIVSSRDAITYGVTDIDGAKGSISLLNLPVISALLSGLTQANQGIAGNTSNINSLTTRVTTLENKPGNQQIDLTNIATLTDVAPSPPIAGVTTVKRNTNIQEITGLKIPLTIAQGGTASSNTDTTAQTFTRNSGVANQIVNVATTFSSIQGLVVASTATPYLKLRASGMGTQSGNEFWVMNDSGVFHVSKRAGSLGVNSAGDLFFPADGTVLAVSNLTTTTTIPPTDVRFRNLTFYIIQGTPDAPTPLVQGFCTDYSPNVNQRLQNFTDEVTGHVWTRRYYSPSGSPSWSNWTDQTTIQDFQTGPSGLTITGNSADRVLSLKAGDPGHGANIDYLDFSGALKGTTGLKQDGTINFANSAGALVHLNPDGSIDIAAKTTTPINLNNDTNVYGTATVNGNSNIVGNLHVTGTITSDVASSADVLVDVFGSFSGSDQTPGTYTFLKRYPSSKVFEATVRISGIQWTNGSTAQQTANPTQLLLGNGTTVPYLVMDGAPNVLASHNVTDATNSKSIAIYATGLTNNTIRYFPYGIVTVKGSITLQIVGKYV